MTGEGTANVPQQLRCPTPVPAAHTAVSCSALDSSFFLFILQKPCSPQKQAKVNCGITWSIQGDLDGDRERKRNQGSSDSMSRQVSKIPKVENLSLAHLSAPHPVKNDGMKANLSPHTELGAIGTDVGTACSAWCWFVAPRGEGARDPPGSTAPQAQHNGTQLRALSPHSVSICSKENDAPKHSPNDGPTAAKRDDANERLFGFKKKNKTTQTRRNAICSKTFLFSLFSSVALAQFAGDQPYACPPHITLQPHTASVHPVCEMGTKLSKSHVGISVCEILLHPDPQLQQGANSTSFTAPSPAVANHLGTCRAAP